MSSAIIGIVVVGVAVAIAPHAANISIALPDINDVPMDYSQVLN